MTVLSAASLTSRFSMGLLVLVLLSCGNNEEDTPSALAPTATSISNLHPMEVNELHELAQQLSDEGTLKPAIPLYLPTGLETFPVHAQGSPNGVTLSFVQASTPDQAPSEGPIAVGLDISQGVRSTVIREPPYVDLNGVQASAQSGRNDAESAFYSLSFEWEGRNFLVSVLWSARGGQVTDEMKDETKLLARSLMADARNQGLVRSADEQP